MSFLAATAATTGAHAEETPAEKIAAGHSFALRVCWACHVVAKDQPTAPILKTPAPSFHDIAQRPTLNEAALRKFLASHSENIGPNAGMPNPLLVDYQIDEIVAYILSLKQ